MMNRKFLSMLLIITLIAMMPFQVFAAKPAIDMNLKYLNLGDSIAYGLSADPGESYFDLYAGYLGGDKFGLDETWPFPNAGGAINLGIPGMDSDEMLADLNGAPVIDPKTGLPVPYVYLVSQADIITVSIGGNNLLTPVIEEVFGLYGLEPEDGVEDLVAKYIEAGPELNALKMYQFKTSVLTGDLGLALYSGSQQFVTEWPEILSRILELNSDAHVIVLSMYNPVDPAEDADLYALYEALIAPMNKVLRQNQGNHCGLANVYDAFLEEPDAVNFSMSPSTFWPDPHPTTLGHQIISEELQEARNPNSFKLR